MKKLKSGYEIVNLENMNHMGFSDMKFFDQFLPKLKFPVKVVSIEFFHHFGHYDQLDSAGFFVNWVEVQ